MKIRMMKKSRITIILAALLLLGSACMAVTAAETTSATRKGLRSRGAIHYQDGTETVVIDSADLYTLADTLDLFKVRVAEQLGTLHTYLSKEYGGTALMGAGGVYVSHKRPSASGEVDPASLPFDALLEGIAASQSIPSDPAAYGMTSGTKLYLGKDGRLQVGRQEDTAREITIHRATADELSAGAAAWVDGRLLLGTGEENRSYHETGSSEAASGSSSDTSVPVFSDFNKVGENYGGFNGEIPYTFTPGKSVLLIFDGPLNVNFDGANMPDSAVVGNTFSLFYWKDIPREKIKVKVDPPFGGYNDTLLLKEW